MTSLRSCGLSLCALWLAACSTVGPESREPLDPKEWRSTKSRMYQGLAMQCLQAQDHDRARRLLQQAVQFDARDSQTLELLARLAYADGDLATASGAAQMLLELDAKSVDALCTQGAVAEAKNQFEQAELSYRKALECATDDPRPGIDLHRLLLSREREAEASELRQRLLARFPRTIETNIDLGAHLAAKCRWNDATAAFDAALAMQPNDPGAASGYALSAVMGEQPAQALDLGNRLAPHSRANNPALLLSLTVAHLQKGDCAAALHELDLGDRQFLSRSPLHVLRGEILFQMQQLDAAQVEFEQALARNPDIARAHASLGRIHLMLRRYHAAVRCLQRAVQIEPGNGSSHALLAASLAAAGDSGAAARHAAIARGLPGTALLIAELERIAPALASAPGKGSR